MIKKAITLTCISLISLTQLIASPALGFHGFSAKEQKAIKRAVERAMSEVDSNISTLHGLSNNDGGSRDLRNFKKSFGSASLDSILHVHNNFTKLKDTFNRKIVFINRKNSKSGRTAYVLIKNTSKRAAGTSNVSPGKPVIIYLYKDFWSYGDKSRLIKHELSHVAFGSKDGFDCDHNGHLSKRECAYYGPADCKYLAKNHPQFAMNHADTYSYYNG